MTVHPLDLHFRLSPKFDAARMNDILGFILDIMQFDDGMRYELAVEKSDGTGSVQEIRREAVVQHINSESWPGIHQIRFSSRWIKGMSVKINVVKREGHSTLDVKGELENPALRERLSAEVSTRLEMVLLTEFQIHPYLQEHERIFGSWLLAPSVAGRALPYFVNGNFSQALAAGYEVYAALVRKLLRAAPAGTGQLELLLDREPPPLLFPELSGERLRSELKGLARLMAGMQTLLEPLLKNPERVPQEPAPVLKYLVLLSMLAERLEGAVPNPAVKTAGSRGVKPARKAKAGRRRPEANKPAPGRSARRPVASGSKAGRKTRKAVKA